MPKFTVTCMPIPQPDVEMLEDVFKELGVGAGVKFDKLEYDKKEPEKLKVTWDLAADWQSNMKDDWKNHILAGYAEMGVVEAIQRKAAFEAE